MVNEEPSADYEVTIFDEQLGWSVLDKVQVTRHGAAALIHEFTDLMWTDVSRVMTGLDSMAAPVFEHTSHIDEDKPYNVKVTTRFLRPQEPQPMVNVEPYGQVPADFPKTMIGNVPWPNIPKGWL